MKYKSICHGEVIQICTLTHIMIQYWFVGAARLTHTLFQISTKSLSHNTDFQHAQLSMKCNYGYRIIIISCRPTYRRILQIANTKG